MKVSLVLAAVSLAFGSPPPTPVFPPLYAFELPQTFLWPKQNVLVDSVNHVVTAWYGDSAVPPDPKFGVYQVQTSDSCFDVDVVDRQCSSSASLKCPIASQSFDLNELFRTRPCTPLLANRAQMCNVWVCDVGGIDLLLCIAPPGALGNGVELTNRYSSIVSISNVPIRFAALNSLPLEFPGIPPYCRAGYNGASVGGSEVSGSSLWKGSAVGADSNSGSSWFGGASSSTGNSGGLFGGSTGGVVGSASGAASSGFVGGAPLGVEAASRQTRSSLAGIFLMVVLGTIVVLAVSSRSPTVRSALAKSVCP